jgi:hypothetical protein
MIEAVLNDTPQNHMIWTRKSYLPGCMTSRLQDKIHELISARTHHNTCSSPIDKGKWREDARVPRAFHDGFAFCRRVLHSG